MQAKKKPKKSHEVVSIRLYGIFNVRTRKMLKVSLDQSEIDMEMALSSDKDIAQCECPITLII